MISKINKMLRQQEGFTLMELMIVVVILGILMAIAIPVYNGVRERAKMGVGQANANMLNRGRDQMLALNTILDDSAYPTTFTGTADEIQTLLDYLDLDKVDHVKWDSTSTKFVAEVDAVIPVPPVP